MKILTVVGARPQFIKASSVSRALAMCDDVHEVSVHTGQHFDDQMSKVFFEQLGIRQPDYHLGVHGGSHGEMTGRMLEALDPLIRSEKPTAVIVYGDTNSTLAGALAAAKLHIPVVHVEAGLRSFNRSMPEEINRVLTDHVSTLLCCPTLSAVEQLRREGFVNILDGGGLVAGSWNEIQLLLTMSASGPWVVNVGDVMLDVLLHNRDMAAGISTILDDLTLTPGRYAVLTMHRAENTTDMAAVEAILAPVREFAYEMPVVFPVHPRTRAVVAAAGKLDAFANSPGIVLTEPLSYLDFVQLEANAAVILTDSGGVQKEAFYLGVPCLTLRDETEWMETVHAGWNRLIGRQPSDLIADFHAIARAERTPPDMFGHGDAGVRIANFIKDLVVRVGQGQH